MNGVFCCPICGEPLESGDRTICCPNRHAFDRSKKGYVNLLIDNSQSSHGDNRDALTARRAFLRAGHYDFLADAVAAELLSYAPTDGVVLDVGCGEGFYTERFRDALLQKNCRFAGTDISKIALGMANGLKSGIDYAVAANARLPLSDRSVDRITALFTPIVPAELRRILKDTGRLIQVAPAENHLMGLKCALYETPYPNTVDTLDPSIFTLEKRIKIEKTVTLANADAANLFRMTPYFYKTRKDAQDRYFSLPALKTEFSFYLSVYRPVSTAR